MRTKTMPVAIVAAIALSTVAFTASAQDAGKEAFLSNNCNQCHSVDSQRIEATATSKRVVGPDLSGIGKSRDTEWLSKYIERDVQANERDHSVAWEGNDNDREGIATWLASLE